MNPTRGAERANARMTENMVKFCRVLYRQGWTLRRLASYYGVSHQVVHKAITGETWSHITKPAPVPKGLRPNHWRQSGA